MPTDSERWQDHSVRDVLRVLCAPENLARWRGMARSLFIPSTELDDAVHTAMLRVADAQGEAAEVAAGQPFDPESLPALMKKALDAERKRIRSRRARMSGEHEDTSEPINVREAKTRARDLFEHLAGGARALPHDRVGLLLIDIGKIKRSLARRRREERGGRGADKQARYLAAEAMMEFDAERTCGIASQTLLLLCAETLREFELFPTEPSVEERHIAYDLLRGHSYLPYVAWRLTGALELEDGTQRSRPGGDLHQLRNDVAKWLTARHRDGDAETVALREKLDALGRIHPGNPGALVVMPRAQPADRSKLERGEELPR